MKAKKNSPTPELFFVSDLPINQNEAEDERNHTAKYKHPSFIKLPIE